MEVVGNDWARSKVDSSLVATVETFEALAVFGDMKGGWRALILARFLDSSATRTDMMFLKPF